MNKSRRVLIIKTGFSEFLDRGLSTTVSLGDVLICTSILHNYKNDHVTWVTSLQGKPLLVGNRLIKELLLFGPETLKTISRSSYDVLVNLEKDIGLCTFTSHIKAKKRYGFYFSKKTYNISTHKRSTRYLLDGQENHRNIHKPALEILFETIGEKWQGELPICPFQSNGKIAYDVGFNYTVGTKWPTKAWPMEMWKALERLLKDRCTVSWQQGHKNISKYLHWIASCRVIVTGDSLGQIVGQALGKKVIVLFGPTNPSRTEGIPNTYVVKSPLKCPHMPCYLPVCRYNEFCMDYISPQKVAQLCIKLLSEKPASAEAKIHAYN